MEQLSTANDEEHPLAPALINFLIKSRLAKRGITLLESYFVNIVQFVKFSKKTNKIQAVILIVLSQ